jgi:hypothetical protein
MPEYGGKRGQQSEADIVQRGGPGVIQAMQAKGAAEADKIAATGEMITGPVNQATEYIEKRAGEKRASQFEMDKMGSQQQFEREMQGEKFQDQSSLQQQEGQQRQQKLKMELDARSKEREQERQFQAATEGKVTFDKATGTYQPTEMAKQTRVAEHNLLNAKRTSILSEISQNRQKFDMNMAEARMKSGTEAAELEEKAKQSMIGSIEKLADLEHKARSSAMRGGGDNPLAMGLSPEDAKKMGFSGGQQGPEQMQQFAEQMKTARNAQAFQLAAKTGDTSYIVPGSKEQMIMTNRWIPQVRNYLQSNPIMQQMAMEKGPQFAGKMINRLAAQLTIMELADPDIAAAAARSMQSGATMGGEQQSQGAPGAQQPGSQPSSQPGTRPGGSGISIPRGR